MKKIIFIQLLLIVSLVANSQSFRQYFTDKACRVDFQFCGDAKSTQIYIGKIRQEPYWGGRQAHLAEDMNLGEYRFQVTDSVTHQIIYADGFSSLFGEWQSTEEAGKIRRSFEHSIQFPYPLKPVGVIIQKRLDFDKWETLASFNINPEDKLIIRNQPLTWPVKEIRKSLSPEKAVDIAVIAEGYRAADMEMFYQQAEELANNLFTHEPFKKFAGRINIYAIASASADSGISKPHLNDWRNTIVKSHYFTFYEPRYLTSSDVFAVRDIAALVPYDAIFVLANTTTYGGGGVYNSFTIASASSTRAKLQVQVHEFGHAFGGLGDEYFKDEPDALDGMYKLDKEPWEPNITTMVRFDEKWKSMLPENASGITKVTEETKKVKIGIFEGGGYRSKGIFRPAWDCRMRTNAAEGFCTVCEKAVEKRLLFLTE